MKEHASFKAARCHRLIPLFLFTLFIVIAPALAADDCRKPYPHPTIKFDHKDADGRVYIPVVNFSAYANEMFRQAPELPPCGANTKSSRTWVDIYDADTGSRIYGFCALGSNADLKNIWFKPTKPCGRVYVILNDRACKKQYKSNTISWCDDCTKTCPNPVIKYTRKDSAGRIYFSVANWADYPNEMFRQAADLPPCGANPNSARTWVDIYNAGTNARIYGFCALGSNADLKELWFKPTARKGRTYIILNDRACKKQYKSNVIAW